mgnify:CR=1 FL=1|jgi:large subunit ribosomal protein L21
MWNRELSQNWNVRRPIGRKFRAIFAQICMAAMCLNAVRIYEEHKPKDAERLSREMRKQGRKSYLLGHGAVVIVPGRLIYATMSYRRYADLSSLKVARRAGELVAQGMSIEQALKTISNEMETQIPLSAASDRLRNTLPEPRDARALGICPPVADTLDLHPSAMRTPLSHSQLKLRTQLSWPHPTDSPARSIPQREGARGERARGVFDTHPCLCYILTAVGDLVRCLKPLGEGLQTERGDCTAFPAFSAPASPECEGVKRLYAIIETGGKQYRVSPGQVVRVEKLNTALGGTVEFDRVLMVAGEDGVHVGKPVVDGAKVTGAVVAHDKAKKIYVFKYKAKKRIRKKTGHRQPFTSVRIDLIMTA